MPGKWGRNQLSPEENWPRGKICFSQSGFYYFVFLHRLTYTRPSWHSSRPRRDWSRWRRSPNRSWTDFRNCGARWGMADDDSKIRMQNPWSEENKDIYQCSSTLLTADGCNINYNFHNGGCAVLCWLAPAPAPAVFPLFSRLSNCRSGFTSVIHNTSRALARAVRAVRLPRCKIFSTQADHETELTDWRNWKIIPDQE